MIVRFVSTGLSVNTYLQKYSDAKINLNRWVSGISEWGNHIYADFKKNID